MIGWAFRPSVVVAHTILFTPILCDLSIHNPHYINPTKTYFIAGCWKSKEVTGVRAGHGDTGNYFIPFCY
jgi:hypothetical protein